MIDRELIEKEAKKRCETRYINTRIVKIKSKAAKLNGLLKFADLCSMRDGTPYFDINGMIFGIHEVEVMQLDSF